MEMMCLINRLYKPTPNSDRSIGQVLVGGLPLTHVSRRDVKRRVILIDSTPIIIDGSLRSNLDPFNTIQNNLDI